MEGGWKAGRPSQPGRTRRSSAAGFVNGHDFVVAGGLSTAVVGWSKGRALRAELASRIKAAVASL
jgi:hypothetical protein